MSYPRFFIETADVSGNYVVFNGESAQHISRSLRMRAGERIIACDSDGKEYECVLDNFTSESVFAKIEDVRRCASEPPYKAIVFQSCPKGDKMDSIVQKAVELGAFGIVAFVSDRCIARYDGSSFPKKTARWQKIALEAAKQSGRGRVPFVKWVNGLDEVIEQMKEYDASFICYEDERSFTLKELIASAEACRNYAFIIGPEGGFSEAEVEKCRKNGIQAVGLGKRILRTETASGFVLSCLSYEKDL